MKKKLTTIIAMFLCAIMTLTAINPATAYAASKTPVKATFKDKTVTLMKDINKKSTIKVKTLKKKWGKPKKDVWEDTDFSGEKYKTTTYAWGKEGSTLIQYNLPEIEVGSNTKCIRFGSLDKNFKILGIKVGMKQEKAQKILEDLGGETDEYGSSTEIETTGIRLMCYYTDGKVSNIDGQITLK